VAGSAHLLSLCPLQTTCEAPANDSVPVKGGLTRTPQLDQSFVTMMRHCSTMSFRHRYERHARSLSTRGNLSQNLSCCSSVGDEAGEFALVKWPLILRLEEVRQIRSSHLDEWLASQEKRLKNTTYNRYAGLLKQLFHIAVRDRVISESPFTGVQTGWKNHSRSVDSSSRRGSAARLTRQ
jgi:hypothetical protein